LRHGGRGRVRRDPGGRVASRRRPGEQRIRLRTRARAGRSVAPSSPGQLESHLPRVALSPRGASGQLRRRPDAGIYKRPRSWTLLGVTMRIDTERLVLRLPQQRDAGAIVEYVSDPEVMRWIGGETGGWDVAAAAVERWLTCWDADGIGHFAVERKED